MDALTRARNGDPEARARLIESGAMPVGGVLWGSWEHRERARGRERIPGARPLWMRPETRTEDGDDT